MPKYNSFCYDPKMAKGKKVTVAEHPYKQVNKLLEKLSVLKDFRNSKKLYLVILVIGILMLAVYQKSWFIAATVNNQPITGFELLGKLNEQFRTQTLNQLINEKIILQEAGKSGTIPNSQEIQNKISEIEANVGGTQSLDLILSQQGQTRIILKDRVRLELTIAKLYDKEASVSAAEVANFLETNRSVLRATDSAQQEKEAYDTIKNQKLSQIFNQKFQDLRQKANIKLF